LPVKSNWEAQALLECEMHLLRYDPGSVAGYFFPLIFPAHGTNPTVNLAPVSNFRTFLRLFIRLVHWADLPTLLRSEGKITEDIRDPLPGMAIPQRRNCAPF
jgi:hypothetical protein